MENSRKLVAMSQSLNDVNEGQSDPRSHGVGQTRSRPTSSTTHHQLDQPPASEKKIDGWIREHPPKFRDVNDGVLKDMMSLALRYFEEVELAARYHQGAALVLEVLDQRKRFSLWTDGNIDLDREVNKTTAVRELFVSQLAALILNLSTGAKFFRPQQQQILAKDTNRVIEQASTVAHLQHAASCPPINILEFFNAIKIEIKTRIDNLYDLLLITGYQVENFEETEPRRAEEIRLNKRTLFPDGSIKRFRQKSRQPCSTTTPISKSSSASHGTKNSHRSHSNPSKFSTKQSSGSKTSSPVTITSDSSSEVEESSSDPTESNSTQASSTCNKCKTIFSDLQGLEIHDCPTRSITDRCRRMKQLFSPRRSYSSIFTPEQLVKAWHHKRHNYETCLALIDTGTNENFILRSIVNKLSLNIRQITPITLTPFGDQKFEVSEQVQPLWQFEDGSWRHQEFPFFVIPQIPGGISMVIGNIAREELKIHLRFTGHALIAHEDFEDLSTREQRQQKRNRQARDATADQTKRRKELEARRAENLQKVAAANAAKNSKQRNPTSQNGTAKSGDAKP